MHTQDLARWQHAHVFGQDRVRSGEHRVRLVLGITAVAMVAEIVFGLTTGSMALLADGLHMGSHATALGIAAIAYVYQRRRAADARFAFGTGKVGSLAGFAGAVLLAAFAAAMAVESTGRLVAPVPIAFDQAILVAVIGLAVNGGSAWLLAAAPAAEGRHDDRHSHAHAHAHAHGAGRGDHNLRAAYLHVLADALTSVLAIVALLAGKLAGLTWLDPMMGIVGAALVAHWSWGLLRDTAATLLDRQAGESVCAPLRRALETGGDRVADLHVWSIGPDIRAAEIVLVTDAPHSPDHYRARIPTRLGIVHAAVEVHRCPDH